MSFDQEVGLKKYLIYIGLSIIIIIAAVAITIRVTGEKSDTIRKDGNAAMDENNNDVTITEEMSIYMGNTSAIKMKSDNKSVKAVSYKSMDENIASVIDGVVIALAVGKTQIITTLSWDDKNHDYTTEVTVKPGKVVVTSSNDLIKAGDITKIKTMVSSGVISSLSYESDNISVADVNREGIYGVVEGKAPGTATITVNVGIGGTIKTEKIKIQVEKPGEVKLPVSNPENAKNYTEEDDWKGSRAYFGKYEQDGKLNNGGEPILWRVLEVTDDSLLLMTEYGLICKNYNDTFDNVTWETSTLRAWINSVFLDTAFTNQERAAIEDSLVKNSDNKTYKTSGGNDTVDKVFLLSLEDVQNNAYGFQEGVSNKSKTRQMKLSDNALTEGYTNKDNGNTCWWLRTPGITNQYAAYVFTVGSITDSYFVGRRNDAVRPVIRVKLSDVIFGDDINDGSGSYPLIIAR